jgi:hypothetical protein
MVKWEQFAQRRKINLEMFRTMSYNDYVGWCTFRKVEPVSKDTYESVRNFVAKPAAKVETELSADAITVSTHEFDARQLKKMRKDGLAKLCEEFQVKFESTDTKRQLISKLLALNK